MNNERSEEIKQMFGREFEILEKSQKLLEKEAPSKEELLEGLSDTIKHFNILLTDAMKITKIGDASQRKLMKANEKIESLNEKLKESEQNIKELNNILMHYIKATDR